MGETAFIGLLQRLQYLNRFVASGEFFQGWVTRASFATLSERPALRHVTLPLDEHEVSKSIFGVSTITFPSLFSACLSTSEADFKDIRFQLPGIVRLEIKVFGHSVSIIRSCVTFTNLRRLEVSFNDGEHCSVEASDLLKLVESCPQIEDLCIQPHGEYSVDALGTLTDDVFARLAEGLPQLETLELYFSNINLTEKSLLSLGKYCPSLAICTIPRMMVCLHNLIDDSSPNFFPKLGILEAESAHDLGPPDSHEGLAQEILTIAPMLDHCYIDGPNAESLMKAVDKAVGNRYQSSTW